MSAARTRLGRRKKKARGGGGGRWEGEREEGGIFSLPIVTRALAFFDYLLFLLGYPAKASSEERALKLICPLKASGFHLFRSVNVRTTTITIKILLFTIYV